MKKLFLFAACMASLSLYGQSFYDLNQIQEIRIYFSQNNWDFQMDTAKAGTESYIEADSVLVNGKTFKKCGVKYKGNSSYAASWNKNPLHIELDYTKSGDYQGYTDIKLGNGWSDNSMIREPLSYAILRQYMDAPQGNFAKVYINDHYYGLMNNAENIDKRFLLDHFYSARHAFIKCNPISIGSGLGNGPNLEYLGATPASYAAKYELKSDTGWSELIHLCDTLNNHYAAFAGIADVDRFLWMLAFNNATVNLDSYTGAFRQNYYVYRNHRKQWIPIVWDLNMCMGGFSVAGGIAGALTVTNMPTMSHTLHKSEVAWPLINQLLNDPFYSKMYLAHLRTLNNENFVAGQYKTLAHQLHELIDSEVQKDSNYLSSYAYFQVSLTTNTPGSNGAGTSPGIFTLMDARASYLKNVLSAATPVLSGISVGNASEFGQTAHITVLATNAQNVYLGFRYKKSERFIRVPMLDDGAHNDGAAGDGVYGADCPLLSLQIQYYIYAENAQTGAFLPERAEHEFLSITPSVTAARSGDVVINELTANNTNGLENERGKIRDWIELYNTTDQVLGLGACFLSNNPDKPMQWPFPSNAFIAPHEHLLIWADDLDLEFVDLHSNFDLGKSGETLLLGDGATLFDQVSFGAQAENRSMSRCPNGTGSFSETTERTPRSANLCVSASYSPQDLPDIEIFPNPATQILEIQSTVPLREANIYAHNGILCLNTQQNTIDLSHLSPGIYWAQIVPIDGKSVVRRFIKM